MTLFRVWRTDGRYKLVVAENERQALRQVRHAKSVAIVRERVRKGVA